MAYSVIRSPRSAGGLLLRSAAGSLLRFGPIVLLVALAVPSLFARGLLVSPTQLGIVGKPGQIASGALRVSSSKEEKNRISVTITDFTRNEEGVVVEISDPKLQPRSCKHWIDLDRSDFVSPETGWVDVIVTARIPADASGSYWALVALASEPPPRDLKGAGVAIRLVPRVAIPVIVTVEGTTRPAVAIAETRATRGDKGVDVYSTVENTGNTAVLVSAAFSLERQTGVSRDAEELTGTTVGPLTSLPGTRMKAKGHLDYVGSLANVQAHAFLRYGPRPEDAAEAVAAIEEPSTRTRAADANKSEGTSATSTTKPISPKPPSTQFR